MRTLGCVCVNVSKEDAKKFNVKSTSNFGKECTNIEKCEVVLIECMCLSQEIRILHTQKP